MVTGRVSVIIPARGERFLNRTVQDVFEKAAGDIEIIAVLDGWWPTPSLPDNDPRLRQIHFGVAKGMRPAINAATRIATGEYFMKLDGHCLVSEGFDAVLKRDYEPQTVVVPRRYGLDPENWRTNNQDTGKSPVDAHFLSYPFVQGRAGGGLHGTVWNERARERTHVLIDDEMSSQGSCWFTHRDYWPVFGELNCEQYGNFVQEFQEIGCKVWLTGGRVRVNKHAFYAHLHKGKTYGRGYWISKTEMANGSKFCIDWWMNDRWPSPPRVHSMRWLIERFWPVPTWPTDAQGALDWDEVMRKTEIYTRLYQSGAAIYEEELGVKI